MPKSLQPFCRAVGFRRAPTARRLALIALCGIFVGCQNGKPDASQEIVVKGADAKSEFVLTAPERVPGSQVLRAELQLVTGRGFGSASDGDFQQIRNILFVESGSVRAHWLLPANDRVVDLTDIDSGKDPDKTTLASVAFVQSPHKPGETVSGKILLFDPSGQKVIEVADGARVFKGASFSGAEIAVLYQRENSKLTIAEFDAQSLAKLREQTLDFPPAN